MGEFAREGQKRRFEDTAEISQSIGAEKPGVDKNNFKERVSESKGSGDKEKREHVSASDLKSQNIQNIANDPREPTRENLYAEIQQEVPINLRNDTTSSDIALLNTAQATQNNSDTNNGKNLENNESRSRIESKTVQPDKLPSSEKDANLSEETNLGSLEQSKHTEELKVLLNYDNDTIRFTDHSQKIVESSEPLPSGDEKRHMPSKSTDNTNDLPTRVSETHSFQTQLEDRVSETVESYEPLASRDEKRDMPSKSTDNTNDLPTRISETCSLKTQLEDRVFETEDVVVQPRLEIAENNSKATRALDRFQTDTSSLSREISGRKSSTAEIESTEKLASSNAFPNQNEEIVQNSKFSDLHQDGNKFEAIVPTEARNEEYYFLTKKNNTELTHLKREHYSYNSEKIGEKNSANTSINSNSYDQYATTTSKINRTVENYEILSPTQYNDTNLLTSSENKQRIEFSETFSNQPIKRYSQKANRNEDARQLLNERYFLQSKSLERASENDTIRGGNKLLTVSGISERYESGYSDTIYQKMDPKYNKSESFLQSYQSDEESNDLIKKEKKKSISKQRQSQEAPIPVAALIRNPSIIKLEPETSKKPRKNRNRSNSEKIRKYSRKSFKNGLDSENEKTLEALESHNSKTRNTRTSLNPLNFLSMSNIEKPKRKSSRVSIVSNMEKDRKKSLKKRKTVKNQQEESEKGYESPVQIEEKRRSISKLNNLVVEYMPIDTNSEEDRVHEDDSGMLAPNNSFDKSNRNSNSPGGVFARKPLRSRPKKRRQPNESPNRDEEINLLGFSPFGRSVFGRRFFSPDRWFTGDESTWIGERQDSMLDEQSTLRQQDRLYIQHEDYNEFRQDKEPEPAGRFNEAGGIYLQSNPLFEDQDYLENKLIHNFNVSECKSQRDGDLARAKTYGFLAQEKNRYQENQNLEQLHRIQPENTNIQFRRQIEALLISEGDQLSYTPQFSHHEKYLESAVDATERGSIREDSRGSIKQCPNTINEDQLKMENRKREAESNELENSNPQSMRITEKEEFCVGIDEGSFNQRSAEDRKPSLKDFGALSAYNSRNQQEDEIKVTAEERRIEEESAEYQTAVFNETQTDFHEQKSTEPKAENLRNTEKAEIIREGIENRASEENQLGSQSKDDPNITVHEEGFIHEGNTKDMRTMDYGSKRSHRLKESSNELKNEEGRAKLETEVGKVMPETTEIRSKKPLFAEIRKTIPPNQQSAQQEVSETITSKAAKKTTSTEKLNYEKPETSNSSRGKKSRKAANSISKNEINKMRQIENEAAKKIQRFFRTKMLAKKARASRLKKAKILKEEPTQTESDKKYPPLNDPSDFTKFLRLVSRTPDYQLANHLTNLYMHSQKEIAQSISKKP